MLLGPTCFCLAMIRTLSNCFVFSSCYQADDKPAVSNWSVAREESFQKEILEVRKVSILIYIYQFLVSMLRRVAYSGGGAYLNELLRY